MKTFCMSFVHVKCIGTAHNRNDVGNAKKVYFLMSHPVKIPYLHAVE